MIGSSGSILSALAIVLVAVSSGLPAYADQPAVNRTDELEMLAKARAEADMHRGVKRLEGTVAPAQSSTSEIGSDRFQDLAEAQKREAELQRLSEKLRRAHAGRVRQADKVTTPWETEVKRAETDRPLEPYKAEQRSALGHAGALASRMRDDRATVLLVMTPGSKGIRRFEKTADPILCSDDGCYVSNGPDTASRFISMRRSLGFMNTFGPRAGACRQRTACAFRGVDLSKHNAILQPVDLKVLVHDRRAIKQARIDETCDVRAGRLTCERPLKGDDFVMWVVPERLAEKAGPEALRRALNAGLPDELRSVSR